MNTYCQIIRACAAVINDWLIAQPEVKEESLTDWFLYDLSLKIPAIKYKQFTRTEEGRKTGADWEWWFVFSNHSSFASRVQAKKLSANKDCYPGIAYVSNDRLQIERLLEDSAKDNRAAFYVFYSTDDYYPGQGPLWGCTLLNNQGVHIASAKQIKNEFIDNGRQKLSPADILQQTEPVACLFCYPVFQEAVADPAEGFRRHLIKSFPDLFTQDGQNGVGFVQTPQYILQLLDAGISPGWEAEYNRFFLNTNAIVVVDLRQSIDGTTDTRNKEQDNILSDLFIAYFRCLQKEIPYDPDLHLFIAVFDGNSTETQNALKAGADVEITLEKLLERYSEANLECYKEWWRCFNYLKEIKKRQG